MGSRSGPFGLHHHDEKRRADMKDRTAVIETVRTASAALYGASCLGTARFADRPCLIQCLHVTVPCRLGSAAALVEPQLGQNVA